MNRPRSRGTRPARRAGLALLVLVLVARTLAFVHLVAEPHAVCVQHDELVHGEHQHGQQEHEAAPAGSAERPKLTDGGPGEGHDDHCATLALARHESPARTASLPQLAALASTPPRRGAPQAERESRIPLHLLAPKTSPPGNG